MNLKIFAKKLRQNRQLTLLTQAELARHLNITPQTVSKWERGLSAPDLDNLIELAELFHITVDELIRNSAEISARTFIAADGGGTKTEMILFGEDGHIQRRLLSGASNPNVVGLDAACMCFTSGIGELLNTGRTPSGIFAGFAGCLTGNNAETVRTAIASRSGSVPVKVGSDILNVIHSVRGADQCIALICGTGSSVFSYDGENLRRYGGWGYLFDDAGSGYDIGRDVIRECLALEDGFGPASIVTELAQEKLGGSATKRQAEFYADGRDKIAAMAPIAFEAYRQGDKTAERILTRNFERVIRLILAADNGSDTVIISGGLTAHRDVLEPLLKSGLPSRFSLVFPELPQIYGAALAVMKYNNCCPDPATFDRNFTEDYQNIKKG